MGEPKSHRALRKNRAVPQGLPRRPQSTDYSSCRRPKSRHLGTELSFEAWAAFCVPGIPLQAVVLIKSEWEPPLEL